VSGRLLVPSERGWTSVFAQEMVAIGAERPEVVGITAAMLEPVGLSPFATAYPDRVFDVGIAEQHAVTSAAGLALGGMHPVVALYSTFLNRAFDQVLMDVALHRLPVTFVLDRAGVTGEDGPSHNGMWDLSILSIMPGVRVAAPRDAATLREELREALAIDGPTALRYPRGAVGEDLPAVRRTGAIDVLRDSFAATQDTVLLVTVGATARLGLEVAERAARQGIEVTVVDPRWVLPVSPDLVELAGRYALVACVEDSGRVGGIGSALAQALRDSGSTAAVRTFGIPQRFLSQGSRKEVLAEVGLTAQNLARDLIETVARREPAPDRGRSEQPAD